MRLRIHKFQRVIGNSGYSMSLCGQRIDSATHFISKDDNVITCKNCRRKMEKLLRKTK